MYSKITPVNLNWLTSSECSIRVRNGFELYIWGVSWNLYLNMCLVCWYNLSLGEWNKPILWPSSTKALHIVTTANVDYHIVSHSASVSVYILRLVHIYLLVEHSGQCEMNKKADYILINFSESSVIVICFHIRMYFIVKN